jgi:putative copper export protein
LPQGGYEVNWTALSLNDGHTTSGIIGFNLGASNTGTAGTPTLGPSTSNHFPQLTMQGTLSVAWDWLVTLALLFWTGILVAEIWIIPPAVPVHFLARARKHSRSLQALCLAGLLVGECINLVLRSTSFTQTLGNSGIDLNTLVQFTLNTNYGHFWLVRVILLLIALGFFWWSGERQKKSEPVSTAAPTRTSKRFHQLRQRARSDDTLGIPGTPSAAISSAITRSQARIRGAVTANIAQPRSTTASQLRMTLGDEQEEAPLHQLAPWQDRSWLVLAGLILLSLVLSNDLLQLAPLPISAGLFSWLALAAQATWFGCVAYLSFTLLPLLPGTNPDQHSEMLIRVLKRARPFLLSASGVLLACELFLDEATIHSPSQLFGDAFGRALLVRDVLLMLMLLLTGYALFYLLPRLQRQTILLPVVTSEMPARRARAAELEKTERAIKQVLYLLSGAAALTLVCVALMNFFAPPVVFPNVSYSAPFTAITPAVPTNQTQTVNGLGVTLAVAPARVDTSNTVSISLKNAQGQAVSNATVKLALDMQLMNMGTATATIDGGNALYTTTFAADQAFTMAGTWVVLVEVDQPDQQPIHATFYVTVTG